MTTLDLQRTVASIVLDHSECAPVFQRNRIDFCCRGDMTVEAACAERQLDPAVVVAELERAIAERHGDTGGDPRAMPTEALVDHIVAHHHWYLRNVLPFVNAIASKVGRVH